MGWGTGGIRGWHAPCLAPFAVEIYFVDGAGFFVGGVALHLEGGLVCVEWDETVKWCWVGAWKVAMQGVSDVKTGRADSAPGQ